MSQNSDALPQIDAIEAKMEQLRSRLSVVPSEQLPLNSAVGRVLAQDICAFRDSPSIDVSAMDGYAVRLTDIDGGALSICGTAAAGYPMVELKERAAVRVFTGGPVPTQAQCVVRREDCNESESYVTVCLPRESLVLGQNIRRQAENARAGDKIIGKGELLSPNRYAGAVTFLEKGELEVFRKTKLCIINTGDELVEFGEPIEPWQIRDSNGPFLESMLAQHPWLSVTRMRVADQQEATEQIIRESLDQFDVILLTGGVSMGDADYVPDAIRACGGKVVFHRIPIRPGKPILGAVGNRGQLILGLPGNPLSVAVTFRRYALDLIKHAAGFTSRACVPLVSLKSDDTKAINMTWFRMVKLQPDGNLTLVSSQGSGDIASLVQADGFVEIPPNTVANGKWPFYAW